MIISMQDNFTCQFFITVMPFKCIHFACVLKLFTKHLCKVLKLFLFYLSRQKVLEDENSKFKLSFL